MTITVILPAKIEQKMQPSEAKLHLAIAGEVTWDFATGILSTGLKTMWSVPVSRCSLQA